MTDVIIVYDSRTGFTEKAAMEIAAGVKESCASAVMKKVEEATEKDLIEPKGLILGSLNIGNTYSGVMRAFLDEKASKVKLSGKVGAVFGTHKWTTGNVQKLETDLLYRNVRIVAPGVNVLHYLDDDAVKALRTLGKKVGEEALKLKK